MKLEINKISLLNALLKVEKALNSKSIGIKIEANSNELILTAGVGDITIKSVVDANEVGKLDILENGEVIIAGKQFVEFIKKVDSNEVSIESKGQNIVIKAGKSKVQMVGLNVNTMPKSKEQTYEVEIELDSNVLKSLIKKTLMATSTSETRIALTGVNIKIVNNQFIAVATDSYRLAKYTIDTENKNIDIIIPATSLNELNKIIDNEKVVLKLNNTTASFNWSSTIFETKLISGPYPNIESLIPYDFIAEYSFNRQSLILALERASILLDTNSTYIMKVDFKGNLAEITTNKNEVGQALEQIECIGSGAMLEVNLSSKYLLEALKTFDSETIKINLTGELKPLLITSDTESLIQLILPVRV